MYWVQEHEPKDGTSPGKVANLSTFPECATERISFQDVRQGGQGVDANSLCQLWKASVRDCKHLHVSRGPRFRLAKGKLQGDSTGDVT